jgi:hypothetical protein
VEIEQQGVRQNGAGDIAVGGLVQAPGSVAEIGNRIMLPDYGDLGERLVSKSRDVTALLTMFRQEETTRNSLAFHSNIFAVQYLEDIRALRDEAATFHFKDERLDRFFKRVDSYIQTQNEFRRLGWPAPPREYIDTVDMREVADSLLSLSQKMKR